MVNLKDCCYDRYDNTKSREIYLTKIEKSVHAKIYFYLQPSYSIDLKFILYVYLLTVRDIPRAGTGLVYKHNIVKNTNFLLRTLMKDISTLSIIHKLLAIIVLITWFDYNCVSISGRTWPICVPTPITSVQFD